MSEDREPVRIAVNVMRARLTVIGFNIAIVSFQINQLYRVTGGLSVPGVDHSVHVEANMALFWVNANSLKVETLGDEEGSRLIIAVLKEMVQPFRW